MLVDIEDDTLPNIRPTDAPVLSTIWRDTDIPRVTS